MSSGRLTCDEIALLRKTLKMTEAEFAERIELEDRQAIKLLESGALKPTPRMHKLLMKLLGLGATRSPKLKKLLEEIKERMQSRW
jgi:DNA-binding transcriptional regulator YiaG